MSDLKLLNEAFESFQKASKSLELCYGELQERVRYLTEELEKKNQALQSALMEVQRNRDFLYAIIQSLEEAIIVIDPEERIIMMNHSAEDFFGISERVIRGKCLSELDFSISHDGADAILSAGGKKRKIMLSNSQVLSGGSLTGEVILIRDITRLRDMEIQYERNKRLIAMGEMAAHIVHEIRNPLCSIELFATMLEKEALSERGKELSRGIAGAIRSLNTILTNMLIFARPGRINPLPVSTSEILSSVFQMLGPIPGSRDISIHCPQEDFLLMGDRDLLIQAILNVVINAIQAMPEGGDIWIKTYEEDGFIHFSIRDSGRGIPSDIMDRIFDPFFTTKENGTGLGLAITAKIIQAHGGFLNVKSEPDRGSEFILSIPAGIPDGSGSTNHHSEVIHEL